MKSKEWTQRLVKQAKDVNLSPEQADEYATSVEQLAAECQDILAMRLPKIEIGADSARLLNDSAMDRVKAAYREAHVKWFAVYHNVEQQLGAPPPFPFLKSSIVFTLFGKLLEDMTSSKTDYDTAQMNYDTFCELADMLGLKDDRPLNAVRDGITAWLGRAFGGAVLEATTALARDIRVHQQQGRDMFEFFNRNHARVASLKKKLHSKEFAALDPIVKGSVYAVLSTLKID